MKAMGTKGWESGTKTKFISWKTQSVRRFVDRSAIIWAIMAPELVSTGRCETSSFHALVTGNICSAETMASACGVLKTTEFVTTGTGPSMRLSWLMRSAGDCEASTNKPAIPMKTVYFTTRTTLIHWAVKSKKRARGSQTCHDQGYLDITR